MNEVTAEIITIGDEILYGQTVDTNSAFMGQHLGDIGVNVKQITTIQDNRDAILSALENSSANIVLITGGLGPTADDITKSTLCEFFDDTLELNEKAWSNVQQFYAIRNREIGELNRQQAYLPSKCICLSNTVGTASGMWFENQEQIVVSMPGVPREMKLLMQNEVIPRLKEKFDLPVIKHEFVHTVGIPESNLAEKIKHWETQLPVAVRLAYLPSLGSVKLRLTGKGNVEGEVNLVLSEEKQKLLSIVENYTYSVREETLEEAIALMLTENNLTISTAESCTGGNVANTLTSIPGSSTYFMGSIVSYANEVKSNLLDVKEETLEKFGAVSEQTAIEMVEGAYQKFHTDICISTTGIAGPDGGTEEKPVGTVWVAIRYRNKISTKLLQLGDLGRVNNIQNTTIAVLNLIRKTLIQN